MKEFLATWIIWQLIMIGMVGGAFYVDCNKVANGGVSEYKSETIKEAGNWKIYAVSMILPLAYFTPEMKCPSN